MHIYIYILTLRKTYVYLHVHVYLSIDQYYIHKKTKKKNYTKDVLELLHINVVVYYIVCIETNTQHLQFNNIQTINLNKNKKKIHNTC